MAHGVLMVDGVEVPREWLLQAPAPLLVTGDDFLRLTTINGLAGVVVTLRGRFLPLAGGGPVPFERLHTPATDRTALSVDLPLGSGWILSVSAVVTTGTPQVGQTWGRLHLVRGGSGATLLLQELAAGYLTDTQRLTWPGGRVTGSLDGAGALRSVTGTNPAAGSEPSETVPTNARWRVLVWSAVFVTDGLGSPARPALFFDDGTTVYFSVDAASTQGLSSSFRYVGVPGGTTVDSSVTTKILGLPVLPVLLAGHRIRTVTADIDAGDDWGAPQMLVEEWIDD